MEPLSRLPGARAVLDRSEPAMPIRLDTLLDLRDPEADKFLEDIQGNIIKGHGRDFTRHLLLKMTGDPAA